MKRVDSVRAQIVAQKGQSVQLELIDELDISEAVKRRYNGKYYAVLDIYDPDSITDMQRKHYYALVGDYSEYTGVPLDAADAYFKYNFMLVEDLDELPSVGRGRMDKTTAAKLLEQMIEYLIQNDVPFRKQQFYLTTDASKMLFALTMKRICWICGKRADIHHVENLGQGRNRKTYEHHDKHTYMALCRKCHSALHNVGQKTFEELHHIKGIQLSKDNLKELNI